jgi:hypothetical protein
MVATSKSCVQLSVVSMGVVDPPPSRGSLVPSQWGLASLASFPLLSAAGFLLAAAAPLLAAAAAVLLTLLPFLAALALFLLS